MQIAIYAIRTSEKWECRLSLDLRVDFQWWYGKKRWLDESANNPIFVLLSSQMPLGWAVEIREEFRSINEMNEWSVREWQNYVLLGLRGSLLQEPEVSRPQWGALFKEIQLLNGARIRSLMEMGSTVEHGAMLMQQAELLIQCMEGRALLAGEVEALLAEVAGEDTGDWRSAAQLGVLLGRLRLEAGLAQPAPRHSPGWLRRRAVAPRCRRCGSEARSRTACAACGSAACAYCEACLAMGRSRACALLLHGAAGSAVRGTAGGAPTAALGRWGLSAAQSAAAGAALQFLAEPPAGGSAGLARFLIWAVTGAGKTEMIFPLLQSILDAGGRVLVAAPRRDVVLELAPRLSKAFPEETVVTLYGGSPDRWKRGSITLATTHQLLRFRGAFDLVVIDEIDAFPYHNDPMLDYAAKGACKAGGKYIYLSATPPAPLQREAAAGRLPHAKVPARFHGHPLPVPHKLKIPTVNRCLQEKKLPPGLVRNLSASLSRGAQVFLFVSRIKHIEPFLELLRKAIPNAPIEGTSSIDPNRASKVMSFRNREIRLLVTTTILERGVTVPKSDVFILDADSELFDEAALIQMAGRAGRSKDDPAGRVVFAAPQWTRCQSSAVRQIKAMNRIAGKGGYLRSFEQLSSE
ncbi:competence protein ComF [Paenibacillus glucanolyticus]|uniref:Competence protein ComF n=1 Tax=Paenibacillus glucanolyticus TaxID=59843 RepID=A0A163I6G2_9BACL|nr:helicase-related protein [Paenibacillus glucanolyticus]KZS45812.1 competence protein ComF [Paenibacillus glucanolyticus]